MTTPQRCHEVKHVFVCNGTYFIDLINSTRLISEAAIQNRKAVYSRLKK